MQTRKPGEGGEGAGEGESLRPHPGGKSGPRPLPGWGVLPPVSVQGLRQPGGGMGLLSGGESHCLAAHRCAPSCPPHAPLSALRAHAGAVGEAEAGEEGLCFEMDEALKLWLSVKKRGRLGGTRPPLALPGGGRWQPRTAESRAGSPGPWASVSTAAQVAQRLPLRPTPASDAAEMQRLLRRPGNCSAS